MSLIQTFSDSREILIGMHWEREGEFIAQGMKVHKSLSMNKTVA